MRKLLVLGFAAVVFAGGAAAQANTDIHYRLNDSSGPITDYSGNNFDGNVAGTPSFDQSGFTRSNGDWGDGEAIDFQNNNGQVNISYGGATSLGSSTDLTQNFSVSAWVKVRDGSRRVNLFGFGDGNRDEWWTVSRTNTGEAQVQFDDGSTKNKFESFSTFPTNEWVFVVYEKQGNQVSISVNDTEFLSNTLSASSWTPTSNYALTFGGTPTRFKTFDTRVDEFRVFNGEVLSPTEESNLYNYNQLTDPTSGGGGSGGSSSVGDAAQDANLEHFLRMNDTSLPATDYSGNNRDFSFVGDPTSGTGHTESTGDWGTGDGLVFDGADDALSRPDSNVLDNVQTASIWFKTGKHFNSDTSQPTSLFQKGGAGSVMDWRVFLTNNGAVKVQVDDGGSSVFPGFSSTNYYDNNWHFAAIKKNSSDVCLYFDGSITCSSASSITSTDNSDPAVLGEFVKNDGHFNGTLDDFKTYNDSLTKSELDNLYNTNSRDGPGSSPPSSPQLSNFAPSNQSFNVDSSNNAGIQVDFSFDFVDYQDSTLDFAEIRYANGTVVKNVQSPANDSTISATVELNDGTNYNWIAEASDGVNTTTKTLEFDTRRIVEGAPVLTDILPSNGASVGGTTVEHNATVEVFDQFQKLELLTNESADKPSTFDTSTLTKRELLDTQVDGDWYGRSSLECNENGKCFRVFRNSTHHGQDEGDISILVSDDRGDTWSNPNERLDGTSFSTFPYDSGYGDSETSFFRHPNGTLQIGVHIDTPNGGSPPARTFTLASYDGGDTWKDLGTLQINGNSPHPKDQLTIADDSDTCDQTVFVGGFYDGSQFHNVLLKSSDNQTDFEFVADVDGSESTGEMSVECVGESKTGVHKVVMYLRGDTNDETFRTVMWGNGTFIEKAADVTSEVGVWQKPGMEEIPNGYHIGEGRLVNSNGDQTPVIKLFSRDGLTQLAEYKYESFGAFGDSGYGDVLVQKGDNPYRIYHATYLGPNNNAADLYDYRLNVSVGAPFEVQKTITSGLTNASTNEIQHDYGNKGTYNFKLRAVQPDRSKTTLANTIKVGANSGPEASLSANTTDIQTGETVLLDASGSSDSDGSITQFDYDVDGDGTFEETAAGSTFENKYGSVGSFDATVRVTDDDGATGTALTTITVGSPPTADITANSTSIKTGETVEFNASGSTDPGGSITSTEFDLDNDGTFETSGTTAQKKFSNSGTFKVDVRVTDSDSNTDTASISVTVNKRDFFVENLPPGLEAGFPGNLGADPTSTNPVTEGNTKDVVFGPDKNNGRVAAGLEIAFNSNVSASAVDSNADRSQGKSYVHLTSSISEVQQKNLYIPRENNTGRTHICPGATSLSETFLGCSNGFNISTGETVNGVTLSEVTLGGGLYSSGDNYYKASGVTGTGGVEVSSSSSNTGGGGGGGGGGDGGGGGGFGADGNISWDEFSATAPVNSTKTFTFEAVNNVEEEVTVSLSVPDTRECSFFELRNPSTGEGFGDTVEVDVSAKSNGVPGAASVEARVDMPGRGSLGSDDVLSCDLTESASSGEAVDLELRVEPGSSVLGSLGTTIQNTIGLDTGGLGSGPTVEFLSITGGEQEESGFTVPWIVIFGVLAGAVYFVTQR